MYVYYVCIVYNQELLCSCSKNALIIHTLSEAASIYIIYDDFILYSIYCIIFVRLKISFYPQLQLCTHVYAYNNILYKSSYSFLSLLLSKSAFKLIVRIDRPPSRLTHTNTLIYKTVSLPFHSLSYNIQYLYFV